MTGQCEWCGAPSKTATCGSPHRGARWRYLKGIGTDEPPWPGSPLHGRRGEQDPARAEERRLERERDAARAAAVEAARRIRALEHHPRGGAQARSGTMLSYRKAVAAARGAAAGHPEIADAVERALTDALAPAQRRKLEADRGR